MKIFRHVLIYMVSLVACVCVYAQPNENVHVYLLLGQSNMAGRGEVDSESKTSDPRIIMLDSQNHWVPATDPVHYDKPVAGVGPAISFAKEMLSTNGHIKIALVPCAWGGSPIKAWSPGAVYLNTVQPYDNAIARAKIAMQLGILKGVLWHQGESDNDSAKALLYLDKLTTLIKNIRKDLHMPALPFVAGEIGYFNKKTRINDEINKLPFALPHTAVVSAVGLVDKGDKLHFNTASARELGRRYAKAIKQLQVAEAHLPERRTTSKKPVVILCFDDAEISHYKNVAPLLKEYKFNATFFVCEMPYKSPGDSVYYMSWKQIAELHRLGFEIGNHTGHHKNMTKLTREEMNSEIAYIEKKCADYSIPRPTSFAYPGNRYDSLSKVVLQEMGYQYARVGGSRYYDVVKDTALSIPSFTMGSTQKLEERTWNALKGLQPGGILVCTIHGVPDIAHPDYTTSIEMFTKFLDYMKENKFTVMALRDIDALK